ncbi:hypothetical protein [Weissella cibaria]|uniref:hypothetical protein n=1 Tax=Weissella cibaria TaxID=137591 RepID=UPI0013DB4C84|nr:hypothetical protein [Weissella cibaria]NFA02972.1 hypothetical protein [Weissella cibaria]
MSMTFDEVKRLIKKDVIGQDVGDNYSLICDGVATGREQMNFIIDELRDEYEKKRVIELPADVIEGIQNAKTYWENVAGFVLNAPSIVFPEIRKSIGEPHASYDKVADILGGWYFGNIEFAVKKEPEFYVRVDVDGEEQSVAMWQNSDGESGIAFDVFMRNEPAYTEAEADRLVAGLTALNARKVKAEE